jgi:hypothetical protein
VKSTLGCLNQLLSPSGLAGDVDSEVEGLTLSSLMCAVLTASTLPALSTDQYATVWSPWPLTVTAEPEYVCVGPPSIV